jgi:hypothetical protein
MKHTDYQETKYALVKMSCSSRMPADEPEGLEDLSNNTAKWTLNWRDRLHVLTKGYIWVSATSEDDHKTVIACAPKISIHFHA